MHTGHNTFTRPYRPSFMDYLVYRIEKSPLSSWIFYVLVFLLIVILNNVVLWVAGTLETGSMDAVMSFGAIYSVYSLICYHILVRVASKSLHDFYPVLNTQIISEETFAYRITKLPNLAGFLGLILGAFISFFDTATSDYSVTIPLWGGAFFYYAIIGTFAYGSFLALLFQIVRQLFIIVNLHQQVKDIDLFDLKPLRAFSRLTATAGFVVFILGAISAFLFSEASDPTMVAFYLLLVILGISIFIAPLISIRTLINKKKKHKLRETDQRIKHMLGEVNRSIQAGDLAKMGEYNTTLGVLEKERAILKGISSYPWDPGTFRSFLSTILLPLLLWWIKGLLEKWL